MDFKEFQADSLGFQVEFLEFRGNFRGFQGDFREFHADFLGFQGISGFEGIPSGFQGFGADF